MAQAAKRGRKAKPGERYACGKLKPGSEPMSGALWQRLKQDGRKLGVDERIWNSEIGRLNWFGEITVAQAAAGSRIAEIYGRFERYHGRRRSICSPSYETSAGRGMAIDSDEAMHDADVAFRNLQKEIPARWRGIVEEVCVDNRQVSPVNHENLRRALDLVATAYGITSTRGRAQSGGSSVKRHTPLHFNQHDAPPLAGPAAPPAVPKPNLDRIFWIQVTRVIAPHLSIEELGQVYDIQQALKQREVFRISKARKPELLSRTA